MKVLILGNKKPQIKAPRVTGLRCASGGRTHACQQACVYTKSRSVAFGAGVSTHGCAMRVRGVENPQGFGIDERRLNVTVQSPQRTQRAQSIGTIIFATFALFAVRFIRHHNMPLDATIEAIGGT